MLVLSRKPHEKVLLPGIHTSVEVLGIKGNVVRLGFQAPEDVVILREEIQGTCPKIDPRGRVSGPDSAVLSDRLRALTVGLALLRSHQVQGANDLLQTIDQMEQEVAALRQELGLSEFPVPPPRRTCKALLVEDDPNERELLAAFLRMGGVTVDTAGDGVEALDYLHTHHRPDVVLLDMGLPRCDGPTMLRTLRQDPAYADLKVFAVSGQTARSLGLGGKGATFDRWFEKPLNVENLLYDLEHTVAGVA